MPSQIIITFTQNGDDVDISWQLKRKHSKLENDVAKVFMNEAKDHMDELDASWWKDEPEVRLND